MHWLRREDLEDRELRSLAPHAARSRDARRRLDEPQDPLRTAFQRDRDRVIHCTAFRRLQHKTQVVAAYEGDHFRSRMTHSLEVSQLARAVARSLRLNTELCEAIALAHDLGHPPFGHVGERALDALMQDHGGFRHNAQGTRIVDLIEDHYGHGHGLNLTDATRRSLLKGRVPDGFPLAGDLRDPALAPVPIEAQLVDLCDRIAYTCHDLDDGLRAGVFAIDEVAELGLWRRARDWRPDAGRAATISALISLLVRDLVETSSTSWAERRDPQPRLHQGEAMRVAGHELLAFLRERFYRSRRVLSVMERGEARIRTAFAWFLDHPEQLPDAARQRVDAEGLQRTVCDHVSGMTDRYLLRVAEDLAGGAASP